MYNSSSCLEYCRGGSIVQSAKRALKTDKCNISVLEESTVLVDILDSIKKMAKNFDDTTSNAAITSMNELPPKPRTNTQSSHRASFNNGGRAEFVRQTRPRENSVQPYLNRLTSLASEFGDRISTARPIPRRDRSMQPEMMRKAENEDSWSSSFFKAANFFVDKLNNGVESLDTQRKPQLPLTSRENTKEAFQNSTVDNKSLNQARFYHHEDGRLTNNGRRSRERSKRNDGLVEDVAQTKANAEILSQHDVEVGRGMRKSMSMNSKCS